MLESWMSMIYASQTKCNWKSLPSTVVWFLDSDHYSPGWTLPWWMSYRCLSVRMRISLRYNQVVQRGLQVSRFTHKLTLDYCQESRSDRMWTCDGSLKLGSFQCQSIDLSRWLQSRDTLEECNTWSLLRCQRRERTLESRLLRLFQFYLAFHALKGVWLSLRP